jgi:hypothetical protein
MATSILIAEPATPLNAIARFAISTHNEGFSKIALHNLLAKIGGS